MIILSAISSLIQFDYFRYYRAQFYPNQIHFFRLFSFAYLSFVIQWILLSMMKTFGKRYQKSVSTNRCFTLFSLDIASAGSSLHMVTDYKIKILAIISKSQLQVESHLLIQGRAQVKVESTSAFFIHLRITCLNMRLNSVKVRHEEA